ncbi:hypothetical protein BC936DRAFT_144566 [Jimgerdemannia flammicorona]|uniref:Inhibitor I9 domain-containing protein n=1 Tax=Jimgerdemannia flammicorona TaxID=994334 RepID=A0A433DM34_9FUNG|nr:hypothetical protein BC936DRAFT_144566 [Jimgerdemannia flammicorona]
MKVLSIVAVVAPVEENFLMLNTVHTEVLASPLQNNSVEQYNVITENKIVIGHAGRDCNKLGKSWNSFKEFAVKFDQATLREVQSLDDVEFVEPEQKIRINFTIVTTQIPFPGWGLTYISLHAHQTASYTYPDTTGSGITTVLTTHNDFGGHASLAVDFVDSQNTDCNGHGTHISIQAPLPEPHTVLPRRPILLASRFWIAGVPICRKGKSGMRWSNSLFELRSWYH